MTYSINYPNQQTPSNYSGVTINISGVNSGVSSGVNSRENEYAPNPVTYPEITGPKFLPYPVPNAVNHPNGCYCPACMPNRYNNPAVYNTPNVSDTSTLNTQVQTSKSVAESPNTQEYNVTNPAHAEQNYTESVTEAPMQNVQSYPPQYYLNNYNYINNEKTPANTTTTENITPESLQTNTTVFEPNKQQQQVNNLPQQTKEAEKEEDLTTSKEIITTLDNRVAEQKELEKTGTKTKIVALTNEYIMSLENYLNNPNTEIRLMASKEILTRLDEDKSRFDDAALNALLNKMLQDPEKLVRIAALSAFSSQLASGNDYTVTLLNQIQSNPNADKEDVIEAAEILLKMSTATEIRYVPTNNTQPTQE